MRLLTALALTLALAALAGCSSGSAPSEQAQQAASATAPQGGGNAGGQSDVKTVSLERTEDPAVTPQPQGDAPAQVARKIIRNATLTLEVEQPSKAAQRVASIAEARGGYVVTSDSVKHLGTKGAAPYEVVTVELRVPAAQFDAALADIRGAGGSVTAEKITGKDVTEEYIDLEARLRTQRDLEEQMSQILKRSSDIDDVLKVQEKLTAVRTEIERVEGRRRFLENQSSLSTVSVTLQPPAPLIGTTGFFRSVATAFGDGVDIAAAITLFFIRLLLALVPVAVFIGLPLYFLTRRLVRRARTRPPRPAPPQYQPPPPQDFQQPPPSAV